LISILNQPKAPLKINYSKPFAGSAKNCSL